MNWLKNLPLEKIGEALAGFFGFWGRLTEGVPASQLPFIVYIVCCGVVRLLWLVVMRLIPRPFKGISLAVLAAVMFTPGQAAGNSGEIAPAMIGVFYAILMKDFSAALGAAVPIFAILAALLVVGAAWQMVRGVLVANAEKQAWVRQVQKQKQQLPQSEDKN